MLEGAEVGTGRQSPDKQLYPKMQPWQAPITCLNICRRKAKGWEMMLIKVLITVTK